MPRSNNLRTYYSYDELVGPLEVTPPSDERLAEIERDRMEQEFMEDMERDARYQEMERELDRREAEERQRAMAVAQATTEPRPRTPGQLILNKTQLREIMAHSRVWEYVPTALRTRINNSVASDGVLFQFTNTQRTELRNALAHGRSHRSISPRLQAIFNQASRWS